jgi:hypothetical protein
MPISETYGRREACWKGRGEIGAAELRIVPVQELLRDIGNRNFFEAHESCEKTLFLLCLYKSSLFE